MRHRDAILVAFVFFIWSGWCSSQTAQRIPYLVRLERSQAELVPHGTTGGLCAAVWADGRLHAERRNETLPSTRASLQIYDTVLDAHQLAVLRLLLDSQNVMQVPKFEAAHTPVQAAAYYAFTADIRRAGGFQHAGFMQFGRNGGNGSNPIDREDARPSDRESRAILLSLLVWMQSTVDNLDLNPRGEVNFCSISP